MPVARSATVALSPAGGAPAPPAYGYFVSTTGSATGDGTVGDPWDIVTAFAGGYPANTVVAGDTVWIRGGTYVAPHAVAPNRGHYECSLNGSAGNYITFRGYPGERAIIDGNYDVTETGSNGPTIALRWDNLGDNGRYLILRDLEITNSNPHRLVPVDYATSLTERGDCIWVTAPHSKVINCVLHDGGEGAFVNSNAAASEFSGNLIYYNGEYSPVGEPDTECAIDLPHAAGTPVAISGTYSMAIEAGGLSLTFAHNNVAGDYVVVAVESTTADYANLSATYNANSMTRINGTNNDHGTGIIALFGLSTAEGAATGSHDVVVSLAGGVNKRIVGLAQSFVNVNQTTSGGWAKGGWSSHTTTLPPYTNDVASDAGHMVVDALSIYGSYGSNYDVDPAGDNTLIYAGAGGGNSTIGVSYAAGNTAPATTAMGWDWDPIITGHGHGLYTQNGNQITNGVAVATDATFTASSGTPWYKTDVGATIKIDGAGAGGTQLVTTIASYTSSSSIELTAAPQTSVNPATATWGHPKLVKNNIFLDQVNYCMQTYGSSGQAYVNSETTGNLFVAHGIILGGLSGFWMTDSTFHDNYSKDSDPNIGYSMAHLTNFEFTDNIINADCGTGGGAGTWDDLVIEGNTITGTLTNFTSTDFPTNTYSTPGTNLVVVLDNDHEANRANIYVFNWESLNNVSVDLDSVVADNTPIYILNAQDYYATPVYSGTYHTGVPVSLPMTGLTVAAAIGGAGGDAGAIYTPIAATGPTFNSFIVRAQSEETWR